MGESLVKFALFSHHLERFIRKAVRGALAQIFSPPQSIFSNNCSQKWTFEITKAEVAGYHGPQRVLPNRNERNLNLGNHYIRVIRLTGGILSSSLTTSSRLCVRRSSPVRYLSAGCSCMRDRRYFAAEHPNLATEAFRSEQLREARMVFRIFKIRAASWIVSARPRASSRVAWCVRKLGAKHVAEARPLILSPAGCHRAQRRHPRVKRGTGNVGVNRPSSVPARRAAARQVLDRVMARGGSEVEA